MLVTSLPESSTVTWRLHHVVQGQQERAGEQRGGGTGGLLVPRPLHPGPHRAGCSQLLRGLRKLSTTKYYEVQRKTDYFQLLSTFFNCSEECLPPTRITL